MEEKLSLGHLAALFTVVNWGTTFIATKLLLEAFTPIEILLFRFVLGFLALWLVCPRRLKVGDWHREAVFAAAGLTGVCLYYLLENIALTFSTASNVGVIVSASPLFVALFTLLLSRGKERPRWSFLLGFVVSMAGICLISFNGSQLSLDPRGDLLAVLAAVVWAVYSLLTKQIGGYGWNVIQTTRRIFGWGTLGPIRTMVYIYLVPVITVVCSVLILHEVVTLMSAGGTLLTLVGLALSQWDSLKQLRGRRGQEASREEDLETKP